MSDFSRVVLEEGACLRRMTAGAAGYDLCAMEDVMFTQDWPVPVRTGVRVQLPPGSVGILKSRSSLATKHDLHVVAGVIDEDYRGEIKVVLRYLGPRERFFIKAGDRIAQMIVLPYLTPEFKQVDALDETERAAGGFGSTN